MHEEGCEFYCQLTSIIDSRSRLDSKVILRGIDVKVGISNVRSVTGPSFRGIAIGTGCRKKIRAPGKNYAEKWGPGRNQTTDGIRKLRR